MIYDCRTSGYIIDEQKNLRFVYEERIPNEEYKYTVTYVVNGKTYIYQQKYFQARKIHKKKDVVVKYDSKNPQKCEIEQSEFLWVFGVIFVIIGLIVCFFWRLFY